MLAAGWVASEDVIDATHVMRSLEDLHTAVLFRGLIDGDESTGEEREENAVLIPIA